MGGTGGFLRDVRAELGKVTWPSREELFKATRMIVVMSIILGLAIG
ncbi:MAG: preprotein translocase subunit SecE [Gemmatimonadetes bacterium]|nr:preprotein translocase subunit SecE [Gemmatimonadota bacterium]